MKHSILIRFSAFTLVSALFIPHAQAAECADPHLAKLIRIAQKRAEHAEALGNYENQFVKEIAGKQIQAGLGTAAFTVASAGAGAGLGGAAFQAATMAGTLGFAVLGGPVGAVVLMVLAGTEAGAEVMTGAKTAGTLAGSVAAPTWLLIQSGAKAGSKMSIRKVSTEEAQALKNAKIVTGKDLLTDLEKAISANQGRQDQVGKIFQSELAKLPKDKEGNLANRWYTLGYDRVAYLKLGADEAKARRNIFDSERNDMITRVEQAKLLCAQLGGKAAPAAAHEAGHASH